MYCLSRCVYDCVCASGRSAYILIGCDKFVWAAAWEYCDLSAFRFGHCGRIFVSIGERYYVWDCVGQI